jgi:hypothetical protein
MIDIQALIDSHGIGTSFWVRAEDLGMTADRFDTLAKQWLTDGGGDRFTVDSAHSENMIGHKRVDRIRLVRRI